MLHYYNVDGVSKQFISKDEAQRLANNGHKVMDILIESISWNNARKTVTRVRPNNE